MNLLEKFLPAEAKPEAPKPPICDVLGLSRTSWERTLGGDSRAVKDSQDLRRVALLPRRPRPEDFEPLIDAWTRKLGKGEVKCVCKSAYNRRCCSRLLPTQAWELDEASKHGGILGPIAVGDGKTLIDLLTPMAMSNCKVAVLLIPANLKEQLRVDWEFYGQHWNLPNLAGGSWFYPKRPVLHVISYNKLQNPDSTELLERIRPDLVIADEVHNLARPSATRTKRFIRYFSQHPDTRLCAWSGTLTKRSITDYAHLSGLALRENSPLPLHWETVEEWAGAIDPDVKIPTPIGALKVLCRDGETIYSAFNRRLTATPGVISSPDTGSCTAAVNFFERPVVLPEKVKELLADLERTWTRPDGEELIDATQKAKCARELACGFFYRWRWPRKEPRELIDRWLEARKNWHRELRQRLKFAGPHLDSPLLLTKAAIRSDENYTGPLPVWPSEFWPAWRDIRTACQPETEAVWVDDFLLKDAADWLAKNRGICWYEHDAFGSRLAELARAPLYGGGPGASERIIHESGSRSVVCSIRAHGTGKNLQAFSTQLVANVPVDGWEQLLGRTHRPGQTADEVTVHVYRHTPALREALDRARELAAYVKGTLGGSQKLLVASYAF